MVIKIPKKKSKKTSKSIGYAKKGKSYFLAYGTTKSPRLGKKSFRTLKSLKKYVNK